MLCCAVLCCAVLGSICWFVQLNYCVAQGTTRALGDQLRSSFALPSSSSPPKLYQRSPEMVQIYGDDSDEEDDDDDDVVEDLPRWAVMSLHVAAQLACHHSP